MDFETVYRRLHPSLFRYLQRLTGDVDTAEDIAQESFIRLLRQRLPEAEAKPWLFTVATNLVRDRARKTARRSRLLAARPVLPSATPAPDAETERGEQIAAVRAVLDGLPERDRRLLLMREEGFTYEEMARAVGVAPSSVGTLLSRALKRFAAAFPKEEVGDHASG